PAAIASLLRFAWSFRRQNSGLDFGILKYEQLAWACQKQPLTKTTVPHFGNTRSGRPGRSFACRRKRNPRAQRPERTSVSGLVSRPRMSDIILERTSGPTTSGIKRALWSAGKEWEIWTLNRPSRS